MKPPPFEYVRPATLAEAVSALAEHDGARVLAGGQSLMAMMNLRYVYPSALIDLNDLHELGDIKATPHGVRIGAMARQRRIETDADIAALAPIFPKALRHVGHRQTRNRGTIGGSLCHLDPAAELAALVLLFDATIEVAGPKGGRAIAAKDFIVGYMTPGIEPDEILTAISFEPWAPGHGSSFQEFSRRHGDFAIASACVLLDDDDDGTISRASVCIGGLGSVPQRLPDAEAILVGSTGDAADLSQAIDACDALECVADFHGGPAYRMSVAREMLRRALQEALGSVQRNGKDGS